MKKPTLGPRLDPWTRQRPDVEILGVVEAVPAATPGVLPTKAQLHKKPGPKSSEREGRLKDTVEVARQHYEIAYRDASGRKIGVESLTEKERRTDDSVELNDKRKTKES